MDKRGIIQSQGNKLEAGGKKNLKSGSLKVRIHRFGPLKKAGWD
jgi:hypothetical protein